MREHRSDQRSWTSTQPAVTATPGKRTLTSALVAPVQPKRAGNAANGAREVDLGAAPSGGGALLPTPVRARMEAAFGADFSTVRIHEGGLAEAFGALAFTRGEEIHFAPGQYAPESQQGAELIGHELAHVVQQRQGRAAPPRDGEMLEDGGLEAEADALGARAAVGESLDVGPALPGAGGIARQPKKKPGDAPPGMLEQLEQRMDKRDEDGEPFCPADHLVTELDAALFNLYAFPPAQVTNVPELVAAGLARYLAAPATHNDDFMTFSTQVMQAVILEQGALPPGHAAAAPTDPFPEYTRVMQAEIRTIVRAWAVANQHAAPSDAAIDATFHVTQACAVDASTAPAERFIAEHPGGANFVATPSKLRADMIREDILKMPTLQRILTGKGSKAPTGRAAPSNAGAWLEPDIRLDDGALRNEDEDGALLDRGQVPEKAVARILEATAFIIGVVEPNVLDSIGEPTIYVHTHKDRTLLQKIQDGSFGDLTVLRAYSESYERAIHVDQNDEMKVIVHEIGHQLENQLGSENWLAIQRVLHGRHTAAGGPNQLISIYPTATDGTEEEPAYKAAMPATGTYSAKVYDGPGATEVMSVSMEMLSEPKKAKELVDKDPLVAAIILRAIAPGELAVACRPLTLSFLP